LQNPLMAAVNEITFLKDVYGILQENRFEGVYRCVEVLVNEAMYIERSQILECLLSAIKK
jgi:hypothetical protein